MNKQEAARLLHPDTTAQVMAGYLLDDPSGDSWADALNEACKMGADALRGPAWVNSEDRLPTETDADNDGYVEAYWDDIDGVITTGYETVINDERCTYWLPRAKIPPLPEVRHDNS